ncbi:MAG: tetratricopeptide repeat protein [Spirochaetaceae bacterium]|nr:MAG: tetratricopeptide repeat protein [Spirochaetaceae bacterium]
MPVIRLLFGLLLALPFFSSCSIGGAQLPVFQGNFAFGRGDFQSATVSYLRALSSGEHQDIIQYNLGNVYYALGEPVAAFDAWQEAGKSPLMDVQFAVFFNTGVLLFETGRYSESYAAFRDALRIQPGSVAARLNLELAYERMINAASVRPVSDEKSPLPGLQAEQRRVLEFVRRREVQSWSERKREGSPVVSDW